jgi:hypothetical protein
VGDLTIATLEKRGSFLLKGPFERFIKVLARNIMQSAILSFNRIAQRAIFISITQIKFPAIFLQRFFPRTLGQGCQIFLGA